MTQPLLPVPASLLEESTLITIIDGASKFKYEKSIAVDNPFAFDPNHHAITDAPATLPRFLDLTQDILTQQQDLEGTVATERIKFTDEYPFEPFANTGDEIIVWRLISRKPANMSSDAKSRPQRGFNFAYCLRSPKYPDKVITVESRPIDHIIEFSCFAKRARLANRRALWLEKLLIDQTWVYQSQGVDRFMWEERLADTYMSVGGQPLYQRPLRFFVRLAEFRSKADQIINEINLETQLD
jgi:hypothetical protein